MKQRFRFAITFISICAAVLGFSPKAFSADSPKKVLVVTVTKGFRHSSIPTAERIIGKLAQDSGAFSVDYVRNDEDMRSKMTPEKLKEYDGFIFANTTGILPLPDKEAFLNEIRSGKGFVGMHSASDTFHGPEGQVDPYIEMLGGEFAGHGAQVGVECLVADSTHPATKHLGESYCIEREEIYLLKNYDREKVNDLLVLDKHPNRKSERGHFPVAWTKSFGDGRVFYTSLGHREDVWENPLYQQHVLGGIKWAVGLENFRPLTNGKDLTGWHLRHSDGRQSWSVRDGILVNEGNGTDLVSDDKFKDFAIRYEYRIPRDGSNSGLYLRGRYEIQILDDAASRELRVGGNGAIYSIKAPDRFASRRRGEWQQVEATIRGNRISVTLNGAKIHDNVEVTRATGGELDRNLDEPGPIMLQGDHGSIQFRNIEVMPLK